jgi:ribosome maturation factor RimP
MLTNQLVTQLLENAIPDINPGIYIVRIHITEGYKISVLVDTDEGIQIGECSRLNRRLRSALEEYPDINETYEIEIGSPGLGEPLLSPRQYLRHVGRTLRVNLQNDTVLEGKLKEAAADHITLVTTLKLPKKKVETHEQLIPLTDIKQSLVQVSFN